MRRQDRKAERSIRRSEKFMLASSLLLIGAILISPSPSLADVGDQYLPQVPDAGGKKDQGVAEIETTTVAAPTTSTEASGSSAKEKRDGKDPGKSIQVAAPLPDQGGGPGAGAVIALSLLGVALVAAVLWLVSRGRRSLADAESPDAPRHQPDTPRGEITGDGPTDHRQ